MSIRVLVNDYPHRTLGLVTDDYILTFKHFQDGRGLGHHLQHTTTSSTKVSQTPSKRDDSPRCMVEFLEKTTVDLRGYRTLTTAKGTLGLITLKDDVFVCVVTGSHEVATVRPGETVMRILAVEFYCLNRPDYDHGNGHGAGYRDGYREPNAMSHTYFDVEDEPSYDGDPVVEHPFNALKKLLSGGTFYYSYNFDLTRRLQDRINATSALDISSLDDGLLWNSYMIDPLISFRNRLSDHERERLDKSTILTSVIRGYAGTLTIPMNANPIRSVKTNLSATLTVISRLSSRRAGTRFNSRGIDDDGNVANFVETETVFWCPTGVCFSYVQVRGSVPIFWESSSSLIPGQQKIQITRSPEATQLSFDRHFEKLGRAYGSVHVVNLLSETKPGEVELTERYNHHIQKSAQQRRNSIELAGGDTQDRDHVLVNKTEFDFHEQSRMAGGYEGAKRIRPLIADIAEKFLYFLTQEVGEGVETDKGGLFSDHSPTQYVTVMQQNGVFRTNCLDCLDRTNLIQGIISQMALQLFLDHRGEIAHNSNLSIFWMRHSTLWADNGDALSKIYAGTGALKSSYTRHGKMSFGGFMADARKSATRLYVNHFEDKSRQNTTDLLLGRLVGQEEVELVDPVSDWVQEQLRVRADEFESREKINVWVGTYNLNGRVLTDIAELHKWLDVKQGEGFEIVVVGFQELVELSPQQIMNTDPGRRIIWEQAVKTTINEYMTTEKRHDQYVLLRSGQLVGAALMIFVKVSVLAKIKNVEGAIKKTGVSGLAGNKGAVAIRMDIEGTSVCFVTAHLAAGFGNYDERNRDYTTIVSGLRFQRDRKIEDHEIVIWAGDFNYRIGTMPDNAKALINEYRAEHGKGQRALDALQQLYNDDQLNIQMVAGQTFPFYQEGKINFLPTYKFDIGSDVYDTSEKARIPAWTDRILYKVDPSKGSDMQQKVYTSVMNLRFSDHRPVYSTFDLIVRVIDEEKRGLLLKKLYAKRVRQLNDGLDEETSDSDDIDESVDYQSVAPGLPPASSDRKRWWYDGDRPIASTVGPPREGMVLNKNRNGNPWKEGGEEDWIMVEDIKEKSKPPALPAPRKTAKTSTSPIMSSTPSTIPTRGSARDVTPPSRNTNAADVLPDKPSPPLSRHVSVSQPRSSPSSTTPRAATATTPTQRPPSTSSTVSFASIQATPLPLRPAATPFAHSLSRTASTTSTSSTTSRKPPPPKPVKPVSLASMPKSNLDSPSTVKDSPTDPDQVRNDKPPLPQRKPTVGSTQNTSSPGTISGIGVPSGRSDSGPALPPRQQRGLVQSGNGSPSLLDDDDDDGANGRISSQDRSWQPLTPSKY